MSTLKTRIAAAITFVSVLGLRPIWSTKNTEGQPATLGKEAEEILNRNFSALEEEVGKKAYEVEIIDGKPLSIVRTEDGTIPDISGKADTQNDQGTVLRSKLGLKSIVHNPYKTDLLIDENGYVSTYTKKVTNSVTSLLNTPYTSLSICIDKNGFVKDGTDIKGRSLRYQEKKTEPINSKASPLLKDNFSDEYKVIDGSPFFGFAGICATKEGVLYSFYRYGAAHHLQGGCIGYSYSLDSGETWSDKMPLLLSVAENNFTTDWRDCKAIFMSNGKILLSEFLAYFKADNTIDRSKYESYAIIMSVNSDNTLSIENEVILPNTPDNDWVVSAGGLLEKDNVIYYTTYTEPPAKCFLYKSTDYGLTWEYVSKIADGYNENSIAFLNNRLYCMMRNETYFASARLMKSDDQGITWSFVKDYDFWYHGLFLYGLDDSIMIAGRSYKLWSDLTRLTTVRFIDESGNVILKPIEFGRGWDAAYSQMCVFETYLYLTYYNQNGTGQYGVYVRRIEKNKLLGLTY